MANKLQAGFIKADAQNLPKVDLFMVIEYVKNNDDFEELRNAKVAR